MRQKLTEKQEAYCRARASGKNQSDAYREAYPNQHLKPEILWKKASELEAKGKVQGRIEQLQERIVRRITISRSEVLEGMGETFRRGVELTKANEKMPKAAADAVASIGKTLIDVLPDEAPGGPARVFDFGCLLTSDFLEPHRRMVETRKGDYYLCGGRGGIKSTFAALEVVRIIEQDPSANAVVLMKVKASLRNAAYAQVVWAIERLGLMDEYDLPESTLRIRKKSTGQVILFYGCDRPEKLKSIKVPRGSIKVVWLEEYDLFKGMREVRVVLQSVTRGADDVVRLRTWNPPRSAMAWVNLEADEREAKGEPVYRSCYLNVPREWLGQAFIDDAEYLKETDELAYRHEYLGEPVGNGTEVFDRVTFRHVADEEIAAFDRPVVGQDFGWYPDPWAAVLSEWQPAGRTLISWREDGGNKLTPPQQAERLRQMLTWPEDGAEVYHHLPVLSDDADPQSIASQRDGGVDARAAGKGHMRDASYHWLQSVRWVIDPERCPKLANEVRGMQYETNAAGDVLNEIPDGDDHWVDAARYSVMRLVRRAREAYRDPART